MAYKVLREREYPPLIPFGFALMIWAWIARDKCAQGWRRRIEAASILSRV